MTLIRRPVLVIGFGNPSRGDDAAGPEFVTRLLKIKQQHLFDRVDTLADFQLQIEHAEALNQRSMVVFADASETARTPFELTRVTPAQDRSYTSHELSPAALLEVQMRAFGETPEEAWLVAIPGQRFGLGQTMSQGTDAGLNQALSASICLIKNHLQSIH